MFGSQYNVFANVGDSSDLFTKKFGNVDTKITHIILIHRQVAGTYNLMQNHLNPDRYTILLIALNSRLKTDWNCHWIDSKLIRLIYLNMFLLSELNIHVVVTSPRNVGQWKRLHNRAGMATYPKITLKKLNFTESFALNHW